MFAIIQLKRYNMFVSSCFRPTTSTSTSTNQFLLLLFYCYLSYCLISILGVVHVIHAEIAPSAADKHIGYRPLVNKIEENIVRGLQSSISSSSSHRSDSRRNGNAIVGCSKSQCAKTKYNSLTNLIDDIEDLKLDVPMHIAFEKRQKKRFVLQLNSSTPLNITFSQNVTRKIYFNETTNLSRSFKLDSRLLQLPCALAGQYDIFIQAQQRGSVKIEAHAIQNGLANWSLLNHTHQVAIQNQNQVRKKRMKVKWNKSKFDFHAMHYCLVVSLKQSHTDFCTAVDEYYNGIKRKTHQCCYFMDYIWFKPAKKIKEIVPRITNVICTGSRTQQVLHGLNHGHTYYLDVFGIHTKQHNMSLHLASKVVIFNRTHPAALRQNILLMEKISGLHRKKVFSFKIPPANLYMHHHHHHQQQQQQQLQQQLQHNYQELRYLVLPCNGSSIDVQITMPHNSTKMQNIYRPTYIRLTPVYTGQRYLIRFKPSNTDEKLRLNKIGLAVTTSYNFENLARLPENITVYEVGRHCTSTTIAWYSSPDERNMSYCIIVFNLPQRNRSSIDYTNYCMDFGKHVTRHPYFYSIACKEKQKSPQTFESERILNLTPGESYLIYVTANLSNGQPLPYQSLKVKMSTLRCNELDD